MARRGRLVALALLWSSGFLLGLQTEAFDTFQEIDEIRLVGGSTHCSGELEVKSQGVWSKVDDSEWDLKLVDAVCRRLDCGSVVQAFSRVATSSSRGMPPSCLNSESGMSKCLTKRSTTASTNLEIICSDFVRLVNGTSLCSGRLEVKSNQSNQSWSSVCEDDFDQQDAQVVCKELGCGAPSVLQGAPYGEAESSKWTAEFQCGGHESALLDCRRSDSARNTCSPGRAVGLTCSEPDIVRLARGPSRCAGELEVRQQGEWLIVDDDSGRWNLRTADAVCRQLDCGSAISTGRIMDDLHKPAWQIKSACLQSESAIRECAFVKHLPSSSNLEVKCSDSLRLVDGPSLCSGRLEVRSDQSNQSNQSNQSWSSVCEDDFDQQDAQVVCRELGCGAPSVLQGAPYREGEAPTWTKDFQCGGQESALLDCRRSDSDGNTCSPGRAVGLTCSEPDDIQLVGGTSPCDGSLMMKHKGIWKPVALHFTSNWDLMSAAVVCRQLDCGSALLTGGTHLYHSDAWIITSSCGRSEPAIRECALTWSEWSFTSLGITCSDSVRLLNGNSLCSGRLEVKSNQSDQSNQSWSSVCEDDFDQQDAQVVCRELGCGAPSVLQGAPYGEGEAPTWTKEFQCGGHESALLDCRRSDSDGNTCSPGRAVGLTCSEPDNIRLFEGTSRCDGTLEMKQHGEWRPVADWSPGWDQKLAAAVCDQLDCGSAVSTEIRDSANDARWWMSRSCVQSDSVRLLRECLTIPGGVGRQIDLEVVCSDFLAQPNISFSPDTDGLSEDRHQGPQVLMGSSFTISCSIRPQYPGGSFRLILTTSATSRTFTLPAVNHSALFVFSAADQSHRGDYSCVYHISLFSRNFSSESRSLCVNVGAPVTELIIRLVILLSLLFTAATFFYCKASRAKTPRQEENVELDYLGGAEDGPGVEAGAESTE